MSKFHLDDFFNCYEQLLITVSDRIHVNVKKGKLYTPLAELSESVVKDLRGSWKGKPLKVWRVKTLLANAKYLGAYGSIGVRSVPGLGITTVARILQKRAA